jgi:hypothetical protein
VATVSIAVGAVNDAPLASAASLSTGEDVSLGNTLVASDIDGDPLTYSIVGQAANGSVPITDTATGAFTYTPTANYNGPDSFTFRANDSNVATVSIAVGAVNDAPLASAASLSTGEDVSLGNTLVATDIDGDPLTYSIVGQAANGSVMITNAATGAFTYTPAPNFTGGDSFTFRANDGSLDSNVATVSVAVSAANDAPQASDASLATNEDVPLSDMLVATDVDGDALAYSIVGQAANGLVTITNAATGAFTYTPNANYGGLDSFTFRANDGLLDTNLATVTVMVNAVNDAPLASNASLSTGEDIALLDNLLASDIEGDSLTYSIVGQAASGSVTITNAVTGAFIYTPNANYNGPDSFTFRADDGSLGSNVATVSIVVGSANDAPVARAGGIIVFVDEASSLTIAVLDPDAGDIHSFVITNPGVLGVPAVDSAGVLTFVAGSTPGTDSIEVVVTDNGIPPLSTTITIPVTINDPGEIDSNGDGVTDTQAINLGLDPDDPDGDTDNDGVPDSVEIGDPEAPADSDNDGVIDAIEPGLMAYDSSVASRLALSNGGTVDIISVGENLSQTGSGDVTGEVAGVSFQLGTVSYVTTAPVGGTVKVQLRYSGTLPANLALFKVDAAGNMARLPDSLWKKIDAHTVEIMVTDGDPMTDHDGMLNGVIEDPVAVGSTSVIGVAGGGGGGGGCALQVSQSRGKADPVIPLLIILAMGGLVRRRVCFTLKIRG